MPPGSARRTAVVLTAVALIVCGSGTAATAPWRSFTDTQTGIRVTIPTPWNVVPPTVAGVQKLVASLKKDNQTALAQAYAEFIATAAARTQLVRYHFQAFEYLPNTAVAPDFTLGLVNVSRHYTVKDLTAITTSISKSFAAQGMKVTTSKVVTLPSGPAAFVEATRSTGAGENTQYESYVLAHGNLLLNLSFNADAALPGISAVFAQIARRFAYV